MIFRQSPRARIKKIGRRFERSARVLRLIDVGAVIPPHRLYSARAPIHPKRPYSLTRPVVPPDGSFLFSSVFLATPTDQSKRRAPIFSELPPAKSPHRLRNAAMLLCGLTVDRANNPVFVRVSCPRWCSVVSGAGQRRSFPQNTSRPIDSSRLRLRPFFSLRAGS